MIPVAVLRSVDPRQPFSGLKTGEKLKFLRSDNYGHSRTRIARISNPLLFFVFQISDKFGRLPRVFFARSETGHSKKHKNLRLDNYV